MWRPGILAALVVSACAQSPGSAATAASPSVTQASGTRWLKGNLHTHSLWSDGNDFPEVISDWYRRNGYDFLAISDHNVLAEGDRWTRIARGAERMRMYDRYVQRFGEEWVEERWEGDTLHVRLKTLREYRPRVEEAGRFLLIQAEEITDRFEEKPLHVNATGIAEPIAPQGGGSVREVLQNNIDAVRRQRERTGTAMVPHVNHPNFGWAVTAEDMIPLEGERFFEVYNGHPLVHNEGDHVHASTDRLWDILLAHRIAEGREVMYGLATDDAHQHWRFDPATSNPGRGWIMLRAPALTADAIIGALERGDFYATSGVTLREVRATRERIEIEIAAEPGVGYVTRFIGTRRGFDRRSAPQQDSAGRQVTRRYSDDIGELLAEVQGANPSYVPRGDELYVRAKIVSSKPKEFAGIEGERETAWTQPVVVARGIATRADTSPGPDTAWTSLFDGTALRGWRGLGAATVPAGHWTVENGAIRKVASGNVPVQADGQPLEGGDLMTVGTYTDFELEWQWKVAPGANSGVKYNVSEQRSTALQPERAAKGFEYQMLDDERHPDAQLPSHRAGALYDLVAPGAAKRLMPVGEWNSSRIVLRGNHGEHWLNGALVVSYDLGTPRMDSALAASKYRDWPWFAERRAGHIVLQDHGDDVWFRNIRIREFR